MSKWLVGTVAAKRAQARNQREKQNGKRQSSDDSDGSGRGGSAVALTATAAAFQASKDAAAGVDLFDQGKEPAWRRALPAGSAQVASAECKDVLRKLGYEESAAMSNGQAGGSGGGSGGQVVKLQI